MNDQKVRLPIETTREGNKITKVCVEDIYKSLNKVINPKDDLTEIIDSVNKDYGDYNGEFIVGVGVSQPSIQDAFDEEIGSNIAFMKAKLNANLKKERLFVRMLKKAMDIEDAITEELTKIYYYIDMDLDGIRKYNPEYLIDKYPIDENS